MCEKSSDTLIVDSIFELFGLLIRVVLICGCIFIALTYLRSKKFNDAKSEFQNLQARLSQLRLALKAKVKRKSNIFRATIKTQIIEGDIYDSTLKALIENKFETSEDFQNYFDTSRQLVKMIQISNDGENVAAHVAENNYMSNDFKTEMDIVRLIKDMSDLSSKINSRVEEHNRTSKQKLQKVDPLVFASITEVNRVFKGDDFSGTSLTGESTDLSVSGSGSKAS